MIKTFKIFEKYDIKYPEDTGQEFWLVDYYVRDEYVHSYSLFSERESAENYIISVINEDRESAMQDEYSEDMYFVDVDEALDWYKSSYRDVDIDLARVILSKKYEGDKKFKMMKNAKKYNL